MRNPARKALYCLLLVLASAALIAFGAWREQSLDEDWTAVGPILLGFALLPFPLYILVEALFAVRGRAQLLAGIGVIARWRVSPAEWQGFRGLDSRRAGQDFSLGNELWVRKSAPAEPVEVIVGAGSALVDGSCHSLKPGGLPDLRGLRWIEGPPACLEFALRYPRSRHSPPVDTTLRIPVPASARSEAVRVLTHYQQSLRPAARAPSRARRIGAMLALAAATGAGGYALVRAWLDGNPLVVPGLMIGGIILAVFAALVALSAFLPTRRT